MRRLVVPAVVLVVLVLAGCGGPVDDLFAVERAGSVPGARLRMVINDDGDVRCNDGPSIMLPADQIIEAREIQRDLVEPTTDGLQLEVGAQSVLRYTVRTSSGDAHFADDSPGQPKVLYRLAFLVRKVAKGVCKLQR